MTQDHPPAEAPSPGPPDYTPELRTLLEFALATARRYSTGRRQNPAEQQAYLQRIDQLRPRLGHGPPFTPAELDVLRRACTGTLAAIEMGVVAALGRITAKDLDLALSRIDAWTRLGHPTVLVA